MLVSECREKNDDLQVGAWTFQSPFQNNGKSMKKTELAT